MNAVADVGTARAALVEKLQHALDALEQGDEGVGDKELAAVLHAKSVADGLLPGAHPWLRTC